MSNLFNAFPEWVESTPGLPLYLQPDDIIALKADPDFARATYFDSRGAVSYLGRVLVVNSRALPLLPAVGSTPGVQSQIPAFKIGDRVEKVSGSRWSGTVCGTYCTDLTPEGYCVESDAHTGRVQIYPAKALRKQRTSVWSGGITLAGLELWLRELDGVTGGCSLRAYPGSSPGSLYLRVSWAVDGKQRVVDRTLTSTTLRDMPPAAVQALLGSVKQEVIRLVGESK